MLAPSLGDLHKTAHPWTYATLRNDYLGRVTTELHGTMNKHLEVLELTSLMGTWVCQAELKKQQ